MANEFIVRKGLIVSGSGKITGSLSFTEGGVTGSMFGTASWANNAISSSYAQTSSIGLIAKAVDIVSGSIGSLNTSYTGSFTGSFTGSLLGTASWATSASWAPGASSVTKYTSLFGNGVATAFTMSHNLANTSVLVQVIRETTGVVVYPDITISGSNAVLLGFSSAPATDEYRVNVYGF